MEREFKKEMSMALDPDESAAGQMAAAEAAEAEEVKAAEAEMMPMISMGCSPSAERA